MVLRVLIAGLALCGCEAVTLVARADEDQAGRVVDALRRAGVDARRAPAASGGHRIDVPREQAAPAVEALLRVSEPRECEPLFGAESDARARRERALATSLAAALRALPWVRDARVVVSLPPPAGFDEVARLTPRALAVLSHAGSAPDARRAQALIAAGVHGMRTEDVRVELHPWSPPPAPRLAWVGPFAASAASAGALRATLGALLGVIALLSALLLRRSLPRARGAP